MHSSFGLPYPAGHWMYSLYDLLDNSVFVVCFFAFWGATVYLLLEVIYRKFNISETVEIVIIFFIMATNDSVFLSLCNIKGFSLNQRIKTMMTKHDKERFNKRIGGEVQISADIRVNDCNIKSFF